MLNQKIILVLKNLLLFTMITIVALIILSFTMLFIDFNETAINMMVQAMKTMIVFFCGARAARLINQSGFFMGALSGFLLTLILLIISIAFVSPTINIAHLLLQLLIGALIGTGGGIIGVNTLKKN